MPDSFAAVPSGSLPNPVRSFQDPATGVTVHQLTPSGQMWAHLYFTRRSWLPDGRLLLLRRDNDGWNYSISRPDGTLAPLTRYPAQSHPTRYIRHMHRVFEADEIERLMFRLPALHPALPLIAFAWDNAIHLLDTVSGEDRVIHRFEAGESQQPATGLHTQFTADGRDLILVTNRDARADEPRLDPPEQVWNTGLRDETRVVSTIWRYDFSRGRMAGPVFSSNGEQSHLLACPWDADLLLWANYLHSCLYVMNRDGSGLRRLFSRPDTMPGHYNFDPAHRALTVQLSDTRSWRTQFVRMDVATGATIEFPSAGGMHQWHQNASPDGRWVVHDDPGKLIQGQNGLWLLDTADGSMRPLCRINCRWSPGVADESGTPVKSEAFHPNPSWSADGRWVLVSSDFWTGVPGVYAVDASPIVGEPSVP